MPEPLLQASSVQLQFGERLVLDQISLRIAPGEIVTLIGPNGAGKTSLVRVLLGLLKPSAGTIRRRPGLVIGYMPQKLHIEASLPLSVQRFLALTGCSKSAIATTLQITGITHLLNSPLQQLSGGETQRVLLARALLRNPDLLVLDEPVQGVDVAGQAELYQLINTIRRERGCGVLMISHDLHLVMAATDTVICLNQHVCCQGHPESVTSHPAYLELFGHTAPAAVAMYTHHHNHQHDIHGDVLDPQAEPHTCKDHHHHA